MIPVGPVLLWLLSSDNPASATGQLVGTAVYPIELPQKPPALAVVYDLVHAPREYVMDGQTALTPCRVQIDAFAPTVAQLNALGAAITRDLSGFKGLIPGSPQIPVSGIFTLDEADSAETTLETSGGTTKRKMFEFMIWIAEQ